MPQTCGSIGVTVAAVAFILALASSGRVPGSLSPRPRGPAFHLATRVSSVRTRSASSSRHTNKSGTHGSLVS